jgi:hypothetical protein
MHSRSKNGVASLAYVTAIHVFLSANQGMDARHQPAHDGGAYLSSHTSS